MSKHRLVSLGLSVLVVIWVIHFATNHMPAASGIQGHTVPAQDGPSALVRALRPNYPYSVVPGGVYSPGELQSVHGRDDVVREHYSGFDVAHARLVMLTEDRYQYASYRQKDRIYWTKKRLKIPKGELLLTDGSSYARARCGNRLSDTAHNLANSPHEPETAALSGAAASMATLPGMALAVPPTLAGLPDLAAIPRDSHTGAFLPDAAADIPSTQAGQPAFPSEPLVTGFSPGASGSPVLPAARVTPSTSGTPSAPGTPSTPGTPGTPGAPPVTSTPPGTPPGAPPPTAIPPTDGPPPDVTPVPEPNTIYLFLVSLVVSVFAMMRLTPKDDSEQ